MNLTAELFKTNRVREASIAYRNPNFKAIRWSSLYFHYHADQPILQGINLKIPSGQTIVIAGPTGAGKTTLIKLLLRFYDLTEDSTQIDAIDLREMDLQKQRMNISLVSQEQIIEAAKKAKLHSFIMSLPLQYQSIIGERGIKLSGGQRQRLSIARTILKNAPILILEEATRSVDTETERAIQESLYQLTKGRTAIVIAHRLSTIRNADQIFVLKDGKVHESGDHQALLQQNGVYANLWKVQIGTST